MMTVNKIGQPVVFTAAIAAAAAAEFIIESVDVVDRITDGKRHAEQYRQRQKIFSGNDAEPARKAEHRTDAADGRKDRNEHSPHRTDEQNETHEHDDKARDDAPFHIVLYRAALFRFDVAGTASFKCVSVAFKFVRFNDRDRRFADFVHIRIIVVVGRQ